jgi:transcriptional regulator with XRE-family HTH domain
MLSWSQDRLAEAADVSLPTIKRLEPGDDPIRVRVDILERIERSLLAAGVEFTNGDAPGVRLRPQVGAVS